MPVDWDALLNETQPKGGVDWDSLARKEGLSERQLQAAENAERLAAGTQPHAKAQLPPMDLLPSHEPQEPRQEWKSPRQLEARRNIDRLAAETIGSEAPEVAGAAEFGKGIIKGAGQLGIGIVPGLAEQIRAVQLAKQASEAPPGDAPGRFPNVMDQAIRESVEGMAEVAKHPIENWDTSLLLASGALLGGARPIGKLAGKLGKPPIKPVPKPPGMTLTDYAPPRSPEWMADTLDRTMNKPEVPGIEPVDLRVERPIEGPNKPVWNPKEAKWEWVTDEQFEEPPATPRTEPPVEPKAVEEPIPPTPEPEVLSEAPTTQKGVDWEALERVLQEGETPEGLEMASREGALETPPGPRGTEPLPSARYGRPPVRPIADVELSPAAKKALDEREFVIERDVPDTEPIEGAGKDQPRLITRGPQATTAEVDRWISRKPIPERSRPLQVGVEISPEIKKVRSGRDAPVEERLEVLGEVDEPMTDIKRRAGIIPLTKDQRARWEGIRQETAEAEPGRRIPIADTLDTADIEFIPEASTFPFHDLGSREAQLRTLDKVLSGRKLSDTESGLFAEMEARWPKTEDYWRSTQYVKERRKAGRVGRIVPEGEGPLPEPEQARSGGSVFPEDEPEFSLGGQHAVGDADVRSIISDARTAYGKKAAGHLRSQLEALRKDKTADPEYVKKVQAAIKELSKGEAGYLGFGESAEDLARPKVTAEGLVEKFERPGLLLAKSEAAEPLGFIPQALTGSEKGYLRRVARRPEKYQRIGDPDELRALAKDLFDGRKVSEEQAGLWELLKTELIQEDMKAPTSQGGKRLVAYISERVFKPARERIGKSMTVLEDVYSTLTRQDKTWLQDNGASLMRGKSPAASPGLVTFKKGARAILEDFAGYMTKGRKAGLDLAGYIENYFPQYKTKEAVDALRLGKGAMYDAMVKALGKLNPGVSAEVLQREMVLASRKVGAIELRRKITWPDFVDVETPKGVAKMRVIETDPMIVLPEYIRRASHRLSMMEAGFTDATLAKRYAESLRKQGAEDLVAVWKDVWDDMGGKPLPFTPGKAAALARSGEALLRANKLILAFIPNFIQGPLSGWALTSSRMAGKAGFKTLEDIVRRRIGAPRDWHIEKFREWDVIRQDTLAGSGLTQDLTENIGRGKMERVAQDIAKAPLRPTLNLANRHLNVYGGMLGVLDLKQTVAMWKGATKPKARAAIADHAFRLYEYDEVSLNRLGTKGIGEQDLAHAARSMAEKTNLWKPSGLYRGRFSETGLPRQLRAYGSFLHVTGSITADALSVAKRGKYGMLIKVMLGVGIAGPEVMRYVNDFIRARPTEGVRDKDGDIAWGKVAIRAIEDIIRSGNAHYWTLALEPMFAQYKYKKPWTEGLTGIPMVETAQDLTTAGVGLAQGKPPADVGMAFARRLNPAVNVLERQVSMPEGKIGKVARAVGFDDVQRWIQGMREEHLFTQKGEPRSPEYLKAEAEQYQKELTATSPDWKMVLADQMARTEPNKHGDEPRISWEDFKASRKGMSPVNVFAAWKLWAWPRQRQEAEQ